MIDKKTTHLDVTRATILAIEGLLRANLIARMVGESTAHVVVDALVVVVLLGVLRRIAAMIVPVVIVGNGRRDTLDEIERIVHHVIVKIVVKDTRVERIDHAEIVMMEVGVILDKTIVGIPAIPARHETGIHCVVVAPVVRVVDMEAGRHDVRTIVVVVGAQRILQAQGHDTPLIMAIVVSAGISGLGRTEDILNEEMIEPGIVKDSPLTSSDPDQIEDSLNAEKDALKGVAAIRVTGLAEVVETSVMIAGKIAMAVAKNQGGTVPGNSPTEDNSAAILRRAMI
ncbi:MAG: hypothetical protein FWG15_04405 [Propionibacteriaceae bacterium]|nr:hypothetical protein [Propionibacteriaceae bacterium]